MEKSRRDALKIMSFVPLSAVVDHAKAEAVEPRAGRRVSCIKGDPGEIEYGKITGDGFTPRVFLDGVDQRYCVTADEIQGYVVRHITSDKGNIAYNPATNEILTETVSGNVEIKLVPRR